MLRALVGGLYDGSRYIAEEMVKRGAAWFEKEYSNNADLHDVENQAQDERQGLWALPRQQIVEPRIWRKLGAPERKRIRK
jgi:endonuclease YncB( thermonuclease family)